MTRTVVPPPPGNEEGGDDIPTKLVKYVPAETLAFFVPTAASLGTDRDNYLILAAIAGAIGTAGYLWLRGQAELPDKRPLVHFYVLSVIAFLVWAVATASNFAALFGLDPIAAGFLLGAGVFLIPLVDGILTLLLKRRS